MQVFLDDEPYVVEESSAPSVGAVLNDVLRHVRAEGRCLASIRCDGAEIGADDLERVLAAPADTYARLDFVSSRGGDLVIEALARVQAMLMEVEPVRLQTVEYLNQGRMNESMESLRVFFEAWRQAHEVVLQSAQLIGLDLTALVVEGRPLAEFFSQYAGQLRRLKEALEARDTVLLSDMLNYEVDATTKHLIEIIERVKQVSQDR
jgi:hypothetical protein